MLVIDARGLNSLNRLSAGHFIANQRLRHQSSRFFTLLEYTPATIVSSTGHTAGNDLEWENENVSDVCASLGMITACVADCLPGQIYRTTIPTRVNSVHLWGTFSMRFVFIIMSVYTSCRVCDDSKRNKNRAISATQRAVSIVTWYEI